MHHQSDGDEHAILTEDLFDRICQVVAKQIKARRETLKRSQRSLAIDAGMHQSDWSRIERALVDPRLSSLIRIQHALELEGLEMLFGLLPSQRVFQGDDTGGSESDT